MFTKGGEISDTIEGTVDVSMSSDNHTDQNKYVI